MLAVADVFHSTWLGFQLLQRLLLMLDLAFRCHNEFL